MAAHSRSDLRNALEAEWQQILHFLPRGWQDAAWTSGAITRRRVIDSAESLLRLIFAYAWQDWSLRTTATWAGRVGLGDLSDVAVLNRLRHAPGWLGELLDGCLRELGVATDVTSNFRLVLTDGSSIQRPGSDGTTWRLHAQWHLGTRRWEHLELTDVHGGESLTRLHLSWETLEGTPWSVLDASRSLPDGTPGEWWVQLRGTKDRPPLRLRVVAIRKSHSAAEQARRQARQSAKRHGHTASAATLEAADYVLVLTMLSETAADAAEILELYRLRWQIELACKRLKSLLDIDELRAFDPALAQTYLLAKLLGAFLVDTIRTRGPSFSPYGYPVRINVQTRLAPYPTNLAGSSPHRSGGSPTSRIGWPVRGGRSTLEKGHGNADSN